MFHRHVEKGLREIAAVLAQVALVVFLGLVSVGLATAFMEPAGAAGPRLNVAAETIWTSEPVRVDRRRQDYERLPTPPDPYPLKLRMGAGVKFLANNAFEANRQRYRLADVETVERNKVCTGPDGRRFACGLNAFKALQTVLRGRLLACRVVKERPEEKAVECQINGRDLRSLL